MKQATVASPVPVLSVDNIEVVYNEVILVLHGVSLEVRPGEIVALLGANGAGKSTTLKAISGLLGGENGALRRGGVRFCGERIDALLPDQVVRRGVFQVMEGRRIIEDMTVAENLRLGAYTRRGREWVSDIERVYQYFPRLKERTGLAGYLSGGEQQMLAIGRAIMAQPQLVMLDEPSMGLSPMMVEEVFEIVREINRKEGLTILLVEQNANLALRYSGRGYIMEGGRIVLEGAAEDLRSNDEVKEFYLGGGAAAHRTSFRNLKSYRRRRSWA